MDNDIDRCGFKKGINLAAMKDQKLWMGFGIILLISIYFFWNPFQSEIKMLSTISVAILMVCFWIFEILPLPVTALLPLVIFPLTGIEEIQQTARHYADPIIFLFMGGFFIALAIEKWNLHRRIALNVLVWTGSQGNQILMGFMLASFLISMWLSNTATTMMMFPIATSVLTVIAKTNPDTDLKYFQISILLGIAYAANIGGLATIIGTPPNVAFVAYAREQLQVEISFFDWMKICFPIAILILALLYLLFTKVIFINGLQRQEKTMDFIRTERSLLGPWNPSEIRTLMVFVMAATLWIIREPLEIFLHLKIHDSMIGIAAGILLFIIPSGVKIKNKKPSETEDPQTDERLLHWSDTSKMSWGILLMFGGGLTLAKALENAGVIQQIGQFLSLHSPSSVFLSIVLITTISIFLSELLSNIAQVIVMAPVVGSLSLALNLNPLILGIPMTLAASCAGMLPMGTPPNAIVFSSGKIPMGQMLKAGFYLNLISIVTISFLAYLIIG